MVYGGDVGNMTVNEIIAELQNKINTLVEKYCEYCQDFDCYYCNRRVEENEQ